MTLEKLKEIAKETRLTYEGDKLVQVFKSGDYAQYAIIDHISGVLAVFGIRGNRIFEASTVGTHFASNPYILKSWAEFIKRVEAK